MNKGTPSTYENHIKNVRPKFVPPSMVDQVLPSTQELCRSEFVNVPDLIRSYMIARRALLDWDYFFEYKLDEVVHQFRRDYMESTEIGLIILENEALKQGTLTESEVLKRSTSTIDNLRLELQRMTTENERLKETRDNLKMSAEFNNNLMAKLEKQSYNQLQESQKQVSILLNEQSELKNGIQSLEISLKNTNDLLRDSQNHISVLLKKQQENNVSIKKLESSLHYKDREIHESRRNISSLSEECTKYRIKVQNLEDSLKNLPQELKQEKIEHDRTRQENIRLKSNIEETKKSIPTDQPKKRKSKEPKTLVNELKEEIAILKAVENNYIGQVEKIQKEKNQLGLELLRYKTMTYDVTESDANTLQLNQVIKELQDAKELISVLEKAIKPTK